MTEEQWQLAFVDSVAASPTIRLSVHSGPAGPWTLREGSRFDPPPLRRATPQSLLTDGAVPTSAAYDNRVISLRVQLHTRGTQMVVDPAATQLQLLMRELDRPTNLLMLKAGTSAPVFFAPRAGMGALVAALVGDLEARGVTVERDRVVALAPRDAPRRPGTAR